MALMVNDTAALMHLLPPSGGPAAAATRYGVHFIVTAPDIPFASVVRGSGLTFDAQGRLTGGEVRQLYVLDGPPDTSDFRAFYRDRDAAIARIDIPSDRRDGAALQALADATAATGDLQPVVAAFAPFGQITVSAPGGIGSSYDMRAKVDLGALGDDLRVGAYSFEGSDTLIGGADADSFFSYDGRGFYAGQDVLIGGDGGDKYTVFLGDARGRTGPDGAPLPPPSVEIVETADGTGRDGLIWTDMRFDLRGTNIEDLDLRDQRSRHDEDRTPMEGIGSEADNVIRGTVSQDYEYDGGIWQPDGPSIPLRLLGLGGNDTIIGRGTAIEISGGEGNDRIVAVFSAHPRNARIETTLLAEGGAGDDVLIFASTLDDPVAGPQGHVLEGGAGNDVFSVRHEAELTIDGGDGTDELRVTTQGMDDLSLTGVEVVRAVGRQDAALRASEGVDILRGDRGDDTLDTGEVADLLMLGGVGDDTFVLQAERAEIREEQAGGTDRIESHGIDYILDPYIEDAALVGPASDAFLVGNGLDNVLSGDSGDNALYGRGGNDTMTGGDGADIFVLNLRFRGAETITDFVSGEDRVALVGPDLGAIAGADALAQGCMATEAQHRLIFNWSDGTLAYDIDGSGDGAPVLLATFEGVQSLTADDLGLV
ncbi:calcium-binding protein [Jannaschia seohaensis]|uniref:Ca2+-binding RTX toxin-like protein n=1 Tax=Jannaschia seohaensis TaxID=475081 RepID=A0A2Y9B5B6_9RHOB|nr:calcium-binding protein [Jannaschia seohaensis]PWJ12102.1 Ca2+-binding RTX toxin-like protein [Jannaschia seohaensis]SSA51205.1 Ca2+-binding protein, RTX toxin-related [Jannaschia seohaensis]